MNVGISSIFFCVGVIGILVAVLLMRRARHKVGSSAQLLGLMAGALALAATWYVLFVFLTLTTGRILAPWDQWAGFALAPDDWRRQLNDFFGQETHQYLVALVVVAISGVLFLSSMIRTPGKAARARLLLAFAATNTAFLAVSFLAIPLISRLPDLWLPAPRPIVDVGYHRTWPDLLVTLILLGLLFWVQWRVARKVIKGA